MNFFGLTSVILGLIPAFYFASRLRRLRPAKRWAWLFLFSLLAIPALLFTIYYLHVLPDSEWFYSLRAARGSELLVLFLGAAAGALASLLPRLLLGLPLFGYLLIGTVPYLKPILSPLPDSILAEHWDGDACLQSTASTCGPASVATILRKLGVETTEREVARAAYSSLGGTEAWYLARFIRARGLPAHFVFRDGFSPEAGLPALVGVRIGGAGHFIAVLEIAGDQVTFVDPMQGRQKLPLAKFRTRYVFTGFHLVFENALLWRAADSVARSEPRVCSRSSFARAAFRVISFHEFRLGDHRSGQKP